MEIGFCFNLGYPCFNPDVTLSSLEFNLDMTFVLRLAANLLRLLCADSQARETIKVYDGIPLLLRYVSRHLAPVQ